jgi:hypothetical protein
MARSKAEDEEPQDAPQEVPAEEPEEAPAEEGDGEGLEAPTSNDVGEQTHTKADMAEASEA